MTLADLAQRIQEGKARIVAEGVVHDRDETVGNALLDLALAITTEQDTTAALETLDAALPPLGWTGG